MADKHVKRLVIKHFTVFKSATFDFAPGINVFIGENGTGKTHLLKLIYSMLKPFDETQVQPNESPTDAKTRFSNKLLAVFRPDDRQPARLLSNTGNGGANARLECDRSLFVDFDITADGKLRPLRRSIKSTPRALFIPSREALAMYEGFLSAYENRELSFDETYFDLCKSLTASSLKGEASQNVASLLQDLERLVGGKLRRRGGRFYVERHGAPEVEAHLMAEGLRKIATLYRLIRNGSLGSNSILLVDEPEAGLNPKLVAQMVKVLRRLAAQGIQIFIATHDYLLSEELSLAAEYDVDKELSMRFFCLSRDKNGNVIPEAGDTLAELSENPILQEFAAHYDREQRLFADSGKSSSNGGSHAHRSR